MRLTRRHALLATGSLVVASPLLLNAYVWLEARPYVHATAAAAPPRLVAIVLGARVTRSGHPTTVLADRLQTALDLHRLGRVKKVLVSGDHRSADYDEVGTMAAWLEARGVPPADVFLDHAGLRTRDTMERAARVFGVRGALVCTQRFHLARSVFLARRAGIDAHGVVSDRHLYRARWHNEAREALARPLAVLDDLTGRGPRHLGPTIDIHGDGRVTRD